mmetsp:Transcript_13845/g.13626  ORF Transcript_13845/g.13626 Transcript_13845/m.13626 type:complete len:84 (-) Transcript_13845:318-569(-)
MPAAVSGASEEYSSLLSLQNRADKLKEVEAELELRKEVRAERGRRKKMVDGDGKVVYKFRQMQIFFHFFNLLLINDSSVRDIT